MHLLDVIVRRTLTDGKEKFAWYTQNGQEQFFRLSDDPRECFDLTARPGEAARIALWRKRMIEILRTRPEGFSDGTRLIPGRNYPGDGRQV